MRETESKREIVQSSAIRRRLKGLIGGIVPVAIMGLVLFLAAGRLDWASAWAFLIVHLAGTIIVVVCAGPELIEGRSKKEGTKSWDLKLLPLMSLTGFTALIVAGLDARFGWPGQLPPLVNITGLALLIAGYILLDWAMLVNRHFSTTVRIEGDQAPATGGPYRLVRHPGYVGLIICVLAQPLLLGSIWALIPAALTIGILLVRTGLEDRALRAELAGYEAYAQQVRYRLLPFVW